ncbi:MAG: N-6 DNA methylase, partial [Candidatus Dormibacteria bacterium]
MSSPESLMTREDVARAASVTAQAVSNWARRHPGFPLAVQRGSRAGYPALAVAAWLDGRGIPRPALLPGERQGLTYWARFSA